VGPRGDLDAVAMRKKSHDCHYWKLNPGRPARSLVTILTELPQFRLRVVKKLKKTLCLGRRH